VRDLSGILQELSAIRDSGRLRRVRTLDGATGPEFIMEGRRLLNFSGNDYLGLCTHPALVAAAREAASWGAGSGASRLICGSLAVHQQLEDELAAWKGRDVPGARALLFNSGYHANTGIIPAVVGPGDAVFSDQWNHASLIDGCRLSRARTEVYRHADVDDLRRCLQKAGAARRRLIVSDSVFSMDGDAAPLLELVEVAEEHGAFILLDEAHATGVLGENGRGLADALGLAGQVELQMGTLGKALGSFGAYVVAPAPLIDLLVNRARSFIFTTALPPAPVAAARAALRLCASDDSLRLRLSDNIRYFAAGLRRLGLYPAGRGEPAAAIFPILLGDEARTMAAMERLLLRGVFAQGIRPPTVAPGSCRLRLTVMATHERAHLDQALSALATEL
jgi:8-amino-7-oxononanoate synthase